MKYCLFLLIVLSLSVPAFSQLSFRLSRHPDTMLHRSSYYIAEVKDNRKTGKKGKIIGRIHTIGYHNLILRKGPTIAFNTFFNTVHPKRPSDMLAVTITIDSINYHNKMGLIKVSIATGLSLVFTNAQTGGNLYAFTGQKESHGVILPPNIYRNQLQELLVEALTGFEYNIIANSNIETNK